MKPREDTARIAELRALPAIGSVLGRPTVAAIVAEHGHAAVAQAVREAVARAREELEAGREASFSEADVLARARELSRGQLRRVINATGVLIHTNLGRVPLARAAIEAATEIAAGYSTLELDLASGRRGQRHTHALDVLCALTGAEDALVVNNNAAAVLLALGVLSAGRDAIVSRGELVEIGGGFRIPEVVTQSGARLREVGTTNRTHLADYERAIGSETAVLLKVHRSNFEITGFTTEVGVEELAALSRAHGLNLVHDAGSGCMPALAPLVREPAVADLVAAGADVVTFSGDKLLGGPQAGILVGRRALLDRMRAAPLYRALRPDKMTLAALTTTLALWRDRPGEIPLVRMLSATPAELEVRAQRVLGLIAERVGARAPVAPTLDVVSSIARVGGGAAPSLEIESRAIRVRGSDAGGLAARLRAHDPPVVARIEESAVLCDLRAVEPEDEDALARAVSRALA